MGEADVLDVAQEAMQVCSRNCIQDNVASLGVWIPGDVLMFTCPVWLRMPALYGVTLFWQALLSSQRSGGQDVDSWSE